MQNHREVKPTKRSNILCRTHHRGAGHHNKPQHTAGRQARRPGRSNRDNTRQQKTTACNQTQQRIAGNHRQQHTAPAGANETTRHHQQDTPQTAPQRTINDHQSNAAPHPRREHNHGPREGTRQRQQGAAARRKNQAHHRHATQQQAKHKTHHDTAARQATTHTEQAQPGGSQRHSTRAKRPPPGHKAHSNTQQNTPQPRTHKPARTPQNRHSKAKKK